jgi:serine/threonine protein kinase
MNLFMAMEYLSRGDLSHYIGPNLHKIDAKEITRNVLQGLKVMHEEGFAHRDIKPQVRLSY